MAMTADKCIEWLEGRIAAFLPSDDMGQGDISLRLPQVMTAAVQVKSGSAFGFTFPEDIRSESVSRAAPAIEQALETWRKWLVEHFGTEGQEFYDRAALNHGVTKPKPKRVHKDNAITASFARLRACLSDTRAATDAWRKRDWLEDDEAHGFAIAPPASDLGDVLAYFELGSEALPPELEALYAEMNGLWTGAVQPPGGEQTFDTAEEYFVFVPIETLLEHEGDRDDGLIIFNQHPDYFSWTMLSREDGGIYHATKLDGPDKARKVAASLAQYLDQLAEAYGARY
jgi:hypothetical protein